MRKLSGFPPFLGILILALFGSCNSGPEVKAPNTDVSVVQPDSSHALSLSAFEAHANARLQAQDTLLVGHEKLRKMLVDSVEGYILEIDEAETFRAPKFTFSEASKVFYNADQHYIEFTAGDYLNNPDFFRVSLQRFNLAMGVEISGVKDEKILDESLKPQVAQQFFAWQSYNSRKHIAWVYIGIDDRYFITIEATAQQGFIPLTQLRNWIDWSPVFGQPVDLG